MLTRIMQALTAAAWTVSAVCFAIFVWQINDGEPVYVCAAWFFAWSVPLGFGIWAYREVRDLALAAQPTPDRVGVPLSAPGPADPSAEWGR